MFRLNNIIYIPIGLACLIGILGIILDFKNEDGLTFGGYLAIFLIVLSTISAIFIQISQRKQEKLIESENTKKDKELQNIQNKTLLLLGRDKYVFSIERVYLQLIFDITDNELFEWYNSNLSRESIVEHSHIWETSIFSTEKELYKVLNNISLDVIIENLDENPSFANKYKIRYDRSHFDMSTEGENIKVETFFYDPFIFPKLNIKSIFDLDNCNMTIAIKIPTLGLDLSKDEFSNLCFGCIGASSHQISIQLMDLTKRIEDNFSEIRGIMHINASEYFNK